MAWYDTFETGGNFRNKVQKNQVWWLPKEVRYAVTGGEGLRNAIQQSNQMQTNAKLNSGVTGLVGSVAGVQDKLPSWQAAGWGSKEDADAAWNMGYRGAANGFQSWYVQQDALAKDRQNTTPPSPGGTGGTGGAPGLTSYLASINAQRNLLGQQYQTGYQDINSQAGRSALNARTTASTNIGNINSNMADIEKSGAKGLQTVRTSADVARGNTTRDIRGGFGARGALDSTYYQRALDAGLGEIGVQEQGQITNITQALDKARTEALKQKRQINMQLDQVLGDLEAKRVSALQSLDQQYQAGQISLDQLQAEAGSDPTKWATPEELNKIQALSNTNFRIDSYVQNIDAQAGQAISSIAESKKATQGSQIDLTNVNNLLTSLGKGLNAGYKKTDFVPLLVSKGMTPEEAQSILDRAELYSRQLVTTA